MEHGKCPAGLREVDGRELVDHIRALRRYARVLIGSPADADDLVQETLKRALLYIDGASRIDNLRAYLFRILHNARNDALKQRLAAGTPVPVEEARLLAVELPQVDRIACRQVVDAIQCLSEEHRRVILLVAVEGMSYREAAEALDLPVGTVMSRLNRARAALRATLGMEGALELGAGS
ncbi:RNA polymerase sigma factor [Limibaculum sp. FT325]|uniref:RNA polymerase sigma factor n=1 Tax=Thermohalobaculum sediminis TaxID=2939436 RepID=UPI0020C127EC|nr:RNA polymerase sigma factor [Limibaculum sediminis]MCL5777555.1 RNA polymerase sigma factor [Limibaculum sediminis]